MRHIALSTLLVLAACNGDVADPHSSSTGKTTTTTTTTSSATAWANPISGDGQIDGTPDDNTDGAYPSASGAVAEGAGAASGSSGAASGSSGGGGSGGSSGSSGASVSSSSSGGVVTMPQPAPNDYESLLTAGAWDDNRNFSFFSSYRTTTLQTPNDGYLQFTDADTQGAAALFAGVQPAKTMLDVSLMVDTTGSMDDEIAYLQAEFVNITNVIESKYASAQQRWSLVLYKDKHDPYIVQWFDFRGDANQLQQKLLTASAGGGGDFPESPERALDVATRLSWRRDDNVARLLFWVSDAPHHNADTPAMTAAVRAARAENIHVYPIAASGIDPFTEYTMRSTAQMTGGRYLFLTDDSGIGDPHEVPTVPCYFVTKLDKAILRMVDIELTGQYREPTTDEILRTGGDPQNGMCVASTGEQVQIY